MNRRLALTTVLLAATVALAAQSANPRIGVWKLRQDAPPPTSNVMTYAPAPGGGMKVTIDTVNAKGEKGRWFYTTMLDGTDAPVTGRNGTDTAAVRVVDATTNEIVYKKGSQVIQTAMNVLSGDGTVITVTFRNADGRTTTAIYDRQP